MTRTIHLPRTLVRLAALAGALLLGIAVAPPPAAAGKVAVLSVQGDPEGELEDGLVSIVEDRHELVTSGEFERTARRAGLDDLDAKGIGKITLLLGRDPLVKPLVEIPQMSEMVVDMLRRSLDAFVDQDLEVARSLPLEDDAVDALYNKVQRDLLSVLLEKPQLMERANYLLWAAHNLERAADRVTNICERIIFTVTGELVEMDAS